VIGENLKGGSIA